MRPMLEARIYYCVPCGYLGLAAWIASELYAEAGEQVALLLVPGLHGILQVELEGEVVYDKLAEDRFPSPPRIAEVRAQLKERVLRLNEASPRAQAGADSA